MSPVKWVQWPLVALFGLLVMVLAEPSPEEFGYIIKPKTRQTRGIDVQATAGVMNEPRLDRFVLPTSYEIHLEPDIMAATFTGHVKINVTWREASNVIPLHSHLNITAIDVKVMEMVDDNWELVTVNVSDTDEDLKKSTYTITLDEKMPVMTHGYIYIEFNGVMEVDRQIGFFRGSYETGDAVCYYDAGLQLRPNNARRAFPCFDDPFFRARFKLSVRRPKNLVALSNTEIEDTKQTDKDTEVIDTFKTTKLISPSNLALIVSNVTSNGSRKIVNERGTVELKFWARSQYIEHLQSLGGEYTHMLDKMERCYNKIASYLDTQLPITKLDLLAAPALRGLRTADVWGLIMLKEVDILSTGHVLVCQELLYQWIGFYASPEWYSDMNINKALVGYLSVVLARELDVEKERDDKWPMTVLYSLYYEYSKRYPHSKITGMKQETAASKVELVLRMMHHTLGPVTFNQGMRTFMKEKQFQTFSREDLWRHLGLAAERSGSLPADASVKAIMESWLEHERLPMVKVHRDYKAKTARVEQDVFLRERPHDVPGRDRMLWWIPLFIVTQDKLEFRDLAPAAWLKQNRDVLVQNMPGEHSFIIVNPEEIGPFVVNYDTRNWFMLSQALLTSEREQIPSLTRAKLLHDAWNLAFAEELSFEVALNMTLFLPNETNHIVWDPVFTMIDHIGRQIESSSVHTKFEAWVRTLLAPVYMRLLSARGSPTNSRLKRLSEGERALENMSYTFLCKAGFVPCITHARAVYQTWMEAADPDEGCPVPSNFMCPIYKWGSAAEWEFGLSRVMSFRSGRNPSSRTALLKTLAGCGADPALLARLLRLVLLDVDAAGATAGGHNFTENDRFLVLSMLASDTVLLRFLDDNWDALRDKLGSTTNVWDALVSAATSGFTTEEGVELVTNFYKERRRQFGSAEHIVEKNIKKIKDEAQWTKRNIPVIEKWLDNYLDTHKELKFNS